jgi:hypothetical protein
LKLSINGKCQPPRKNRALSDDLRIILLYSARKNSANPIAEYSTLYPETSSASASGRSNGCRFVSAREVIKKIIIIGKRGAASQIVLICISTIVEKLTVPATRISEIRVEPRATS